MPHSRRAFLRDGLCSVVSAGLLLTGSRAGLGQTAQSPGRVSSSTQTEIPIDAQKDPVFFFRQETFKPYVNGIFQAPNARGEMIDLRLTKVEAFKSSDKLTTRQTRSEEHTSELQSPCNLVCRLLLEKKKAVSQKEATATEGGDPEE